MRTLRGLVAFAARSAAGAVAAAGVLSRACVANDVSNDKRKYRKHDKPHRYCAPVVCQKSKHIALLSDLYLAGELDALLVWACKHKDHKRQYLYRKYQPDNVRTPRKEQAELIYH